MSPRGAGSGREAKILWDPRPGITECNYWTRSFERLVYCEPSHPMA